METKIKKDPAIIGWVNQHTKAPRIIQLIIAKFPKIRTDFEYSFPDVIVISSY